MEPENGWVFQKPEATIPGDPCFSGQAAVERWEGSMKHSFFLPEKFTGCLGYIGDDILASYIGIIINHYKDPYKKNQDSIESKAVFFFMAHVGHTFQVKMLTWWRRCGLPPWKSFVCKHRRNCMRRSCWEKWWFHWISWHMLGGAELRSGGTYIPFIIES